MSWEFIQEEELVCKNCYLVLQGLTMGCIVIWYVELLLWVVRSPTIWNMKNLSTLSEFTHTWWTGTMWCKQYPTSGNSGCWAMDRQISATSELWQIIVIYGKLWQFMVNYSQKQPGMSINAIFWHLKPFNGTFCHFCILMAQDDFFLKHYVHEGHLGGSISKSKHVWLHCGTFLLHTVLCGTWLVTMIHIHFAGCFCFW